MWPRMHTEESDSKEESELGLHSIDNSQFGKNKDYTVQIFTEADSPYFIVPETIQKILINAKGTNGSIEPDNVDIQSLTYEERISGNHYCLYNLVRNKDIYYQCYDCTTQQFQQQAIICEACFIPENHIGHHYYQQTSRARDDFCDCGSQLKMKQCMKCPHHGQEKKFQILFSGTVSQKFIIEITGLLQVASYLYHNTFFESILEKLQKLCINSIFYSKLTLEILKKESKYFHEQNNEMKVKSFFGIMSELINIKKLCLILSSNRQIKFQLALYISENFPQHQLVSSTYFESKVIFDYETLKYLTQVGNFNKNFYKNYEQFAFSKKVQEKSLFVLYLQKLIQGLSKEKEENKDSGQLNFAQQFEISNDVITSQGIAWVFLKELIKTYVKQKGSNKKLKARKTNFKKGASLYKETHFEKHYNMVYQLIIKGILMVTNSDLERIINFRQNLAQKGIPDHKFEEVIGELCLYCMQLFFSRNDQSSNQTPVIMISIVSLIVKSPYKKQATNAFWLSLTGTLQSFQHVISNIYELVAALVWSRSHLVLYSNHLSYLKGQSENSKDSNREKEALLFFQRYLGINQIILRETLIQMQKQYLLQFDGIGKVLRTNCTFNEQEQAFYYNGPKVEKKFQNTFPFNLKQSSVEQMTTSMQANTNIHIDCSANTTIPQDVTNLLSTILNSSFLIDVIQDYWQDNKKKRDTSKKDAYLLIFSKILISQFTQSQKIKEQVQKYISQPNTISTLTQNKTQLQMIERLLTGRRISDEKQNNMKQQGQVQLLKGLSPQEQKAKQQLSQKHQKKKEKLLKKFQDSRTKIFNQLNSKNICVSIENDEDICMTCRQKSKQNNDLVYLCKIKIENSFSKAMFEDNDKANMNLYTCFHVLHLSCFLQKYQSRSYVQCPLCNMKANCFLIRKYQKSNQKLNTIFNNLLTSTLIIKFRQYYLRSPFIVFFRHFVSSKGLSKLTNKTNKSQKIKILNKSDAYIEDLMIQIYNQSEEVEKIRIHQQIEKFIQSLNQCNNQAVKLLQLVLADSIYLKLLFGLKFDVKIDPLLRLRALIKKQDFDFVISEVSGICGSEVVLPETGEGSDEAKLSLDFQLKDIPRDSQQLKKLIKRNLCKGNHNKKADYMCLICGCFICDDCNTLNTGCLDHHGLSAYINLQDYLLHLQKQQKNIEQDIYFNDFHIPYQQKDGEYKGKELFRLQVLEVNRAIQQFLWE